MSDSRHTKDNTKRRARCIMATDSEWHVISQRAKAARMPISRYVVERLLTDNETEETESDILPAALQRRLARDLTVLMRIEELRFRNEGLAEDWDRIVSAAEAGIESELAVG